MSSVQPRLRASSSSAFRPASRLAVLRQQSQSIETISEFGSVHVVQKNFPLEVVLGTAPGAAPVAFLDHSFDARLVFATSEGEGREVESTKIKSLEYQARPSPNGDQLIVVLRICVLSSKCENSLFRVRFTLTKAAASAQDASQSLTCTSAPIKVVARLKHDQPPQKRAKPAQKVGVIASIAAKLDKQCDTEASILYERTDLEQALASLFSLLQALKPTERAERLAQMMAALPRKEGELARSLSEIFATACNELADFPSFTPPANPPVPATINASPSTTALRLTNALRESNAGFSLSTSQAGLVSNDTDFFRMISFDQT